MLLELSLYSRWDWSCALGRHQWPHFKRKCKSTQDTESKKLSVKTAADATAGDNGRFFRPELKRTGGFLAVLNREENLTFFGRHVLTQSNRDTVHI